jgi:hypothetical protein
MLIHKLNRLRVTSFLFASNQGYIFMIYVYTYIIRVSPFQFPLNQHKNKVHCTVESDPMCLRIVMSAIYSNK